MNERLITVKEVELNNNCPECYNTEGLQLTFKQKFIETNFYRKVTQDVVYEMECKNCNTIIYPVRWTDDIERVFEYQKKAFVPKKTSLKLKRKAWISIIITIAAIITIILLVALPKI